MQLTRSKLLIIALVVSIGINLLILGSMIGRELRQGPPTQTPPNLGWLMPDRKPSVRFKLCARLKENSANIGKLRNNIREAQQNFRKMAMAEPLDETAVRMALEEVRASHFAFQEMMHSEMVDIIGELDVPDRRKAIR